MQALRDARRDTPAARPLPPVTRDDQAFIDDVPFDVDSDMSDLGAVTLLTGVRFNDLKGRGPNEVDSLAQIHGDPNTQREHCLRGPTADEPNGTQSALVDCRAFVKEKILDALGGLDAAGNPDPAARVSMAVDLSLRGGVDAELPRYYARMGEALHAIQDGFTHTYRAGDRTRVTVVLNYLEVVEGDHVIERDGPGHSRELDRCDDPDELRARNRVLAVQASQELIHASLEAERSPEQKMANVETILEKYFAYEAGCNATNNWCNAPENKLADSGGCGCSIIGNGRASTFLASGIGLALALALARRLRGKRRTNMRETAAKRASGVPLFLGLIAVGLAAPSIARAQSTGPSPPTTAAASAAASAAAPTAPPPAASDTPPGGVPQVVQLQEGANPAVAHAPVTQEEVEAERKEQTHGSPFGIYVAGAGSVSNPAIAGIVGVRLRLSDHWMLGLDGELNGWIGTHSGRLRTGATNLYGSLIVRFPLRFKQVNLRSAVQLGAAIQMLDLVGVPSGSTGIFAGFNPLGVEWKMTGHLYAILYPLGIALPVTQLKGAPFAYPQYRTTLGLELSF